MILFSVFPLLAFSVAVVVLLGILRSGVSKAIGLDIPNERSLHTTPVSRLGGVAIIAGVAVALVWGAELTLVAALLALAAISFVDDLRGVHPWLRLTIHVFVIAGYFWASFGPIVSIMVLVVSILLAVWVTNLYNFMDGIDGLAGGMAVLGFAAYAAGFLVAEEYTWAAICLSVASASGVFLWFNFSPAKVYMGDTGSIPLGFLVAALGTTGWTLGVWPIWFPVLVFSAFIADATLTLVKRGLRGEKIWLAHREHYYQKLVLLGLGHQKTALLEYALITASCISALIALTLSERLQWMFVVIVFVLYGVLFVKIDSKWRGLANE